MIWIIRTYLESIHSKATQRKKIAVDQLEEHVIKAYETQNHYLQAGGYSAFYQAIKQLEKEGLIAPLRSSGMNGRTPPLPTHYWLLPPSPSAKWSEVQMMRVADRLQMERYRQNPSLQTDEEWERIERVYLFLRTADLREWATREERSLELFGNEKWLSEGEGIAFLSRIGISLEDLKARVYGEPFVFWPRPGVKLALVRKVLIVENLSFFHTCKRVLESGGAIPGEEPDLVIYGEGKKIESSLPFLFDLIPGGSKPAVIHYAGDIDAEGWGIYLRLTRRYPDLPIRLAFPIYATMVNAAEEYSQLPLYTDQVEKDEVLQEVVRSFHEAGYADIAGRIKELWYERRRIPQEVLTYERLMKL